MPYQYLGADDRAGPNHTGQPTVTSHYERRPDGSTATIRGCPPLRQQSTPYLNNPFCAAAAARGSGIESAPNGGDARLGRVRADRTVCTERERAPRRFR